MALIGKIRNNMWAVFVIIALATLSFILMDSQMFTGMGGVSNAVGEIDGQKVTNQEFESAYRAAFSNSQNPEANRASLWNYFVEQKIVKKEADALGLRVSDDEMMELQFGPNISPVIYQQFRNPQTGQIDMKQLQQIKSQLESGQPVAPQFAQYWKELQKQVVKTQLQQKLTGMTQKAVYTPNWMAEMKYAEQNSTASAAIVKIPFDNIPDQGIEVADSDIMSYVNARKSDFERKEEMRVLQYVKMNVYPSPLDSAKHREEIGELITKLETTDNDSLFAISNKGFYRKYYSKAEEINEKISADLADMEVGKVYGPYTVNNNYQAVKLSDKRIVPDSARASHIFKAFNPEQPQTITAAEALIDSLKGVVESGQAQFDSLVIRYSDDNATKADGGDLGYFTQGAMLPSFNEMGFLSGEVGKYYKLRSPNGFHLVKLEDQVFIDREPKYQLTYVNVPIIPSKQTQSDMYEKMVNLVSSNATLDKLNEAVGNIGNLEMVTTNPVDINGFRISGLQPGGVTRDIVKWAFEAETSVNDVSPRVYEYQDPNLYYTNALVIAGLDKILPAGMPTADEIRDQVEVAVRNELKAKSIINDLGSNLNSTASKYQTRVDTIDGINMNNAFIAGIGNEPKVLGSIFGQEANGTPSSVIGNSGVFLVKTLNKREAGDATGLTFLKQTVSTQEKRSVAGKLIQGMRDEIEINDNRSKFY